MSPAIARATEQFSHAAFRAAGRFAFKGEQISFEFNKRASWFFGTLPNWAIDKDNIFELLREILPKGYMTRLNVAAFLCVLSNKHTHSKFGPVRFLNNFLDLYNADNFDEVCQIEEVKVQSKEGRILKQIHEQRGLDAVKIRLWAKDLERSGSSFFGKLRGTHKPVTVPEIEQLVDLYVSPANDNGKVGDPSAFPKDEYLPLLRQMRKEDRISETQTALILCFILHAKETRNGGISYIKHPMAVAKGVDAIGHAFGLNEKQIWQAKLVALLHDGGEKTTLKIMDDLKGLLPQKIIDAIDAMHKRDGETYFQYLQRCCSNPLAAAVKLADLAHNSSDAENPSAKQAFIYPVSAAYVQYRIINHDKKISVEQFAKQHLNISPAHFDELNDMSESKDVKDADGNVIEKAAKKRKATEFPHLQTALNGLMSVRDIITGIIQSHAHSRREEALALRP